MPESTSATIDIDAPVERCFAVAADIAAYPDWAMGVRSTEVLETDAQGRVTRAHFVLDALLRRLAYDLRYTYDAPHAMSWTAEPGGDLAAMEGSYRFSAVEAGQTRVSYALHVEPGFSLPAFLRRSIERRITQTALSGLRDRVQSLPEG